MGLIMMIEFLKKVWFDELKERQDEYMKDHILTPNKDNWKDDRSWR